MSLMLGSEMVGIHTRREVQRQPVLPRKLQRWLVRKLQRQLQRKRQQQRKWQRQHPSQLGRRPQQLKRGGNEGLGTLKLKFDYHHINCVHCEA